MDYQNPYNNSGLLGTYNGIRIIDAPAVGDSWEDWSGVRSRGRAERRLKRGFAQRIVVRYRANGTVIHDKINNIIYMHPSDRRVFEQRIKTQRY